ncbi:hypothetical protein HanRHA438_Chr10g0477061 [Helianthus annuus]|uniref:Uncharacterized protein n=2 Tax=Helianthus annuus TaxID=4232 RepID=A0A9K3E3F9_HELAN|nr:hypothetical protein HanXRQr2_Chr15g0712771 [Helianthus annuus]KAJ0452650.1 hypothetical protein HanHA300_Chr15g0581321 [Helianthus annuus]KAJ0474560.1 hypothetical protein HanHA89_Chr15g0631071 [Helianthus annuus]KAJ0650117.1 hypothetical protein HanLR1_Chr15g0591991 [Helianthus annuus]KAJ0846456.1 hypothetical protein HanRHA438_Chr15g0725051 [Helianthus annuus]
MNGNRVSTPADALYNPHLVSPEERPVLNGLTSFPESETSPRSSSGSNGIVQPRFARASSLGVALHKEIVAALADLLYNDEKLSLIDVADIEQILNHSEMTTQVFLQAVRYLAQSMLENIEVIESVQHLSTNTMEALKGLRKISNILSEM